MNRTALLICLTLSATLAGCEPTDRPTNLANTKAIEKAKAVEGQLQQRADAPPRADEEQK